ncbi:MAG: hypothetical protein JRC93_01205 [Deltaproteobacteria bacterium]|nr:hypothetical protein [Deltaproteobacteria bacterium]
MTGNRGQYSSGELAVLLLNRHAEVRHLKPVAPIKMAILALLLDGDNKHENYISEQMWGRQQMMHKKTKKY